MSEVWVGIAIDDLVRPNDYRPVSRHFSEIEAKEAATQLILSSDCDHCVIKHYSLPDVSDLSVPEVVTA